MTQRYVNPKYCTAFLIRSVAELKFLRNVGFMTLLSVFYNYVVRISNVEIICFCQTSHIFHVHLFYHKLKSPIYLSNWANILRNLVQTK